MANEPISQTVTYGRPYTVAESYPNHPEWIIYEPPARWYVRPLIITEVTA